MDQTASIWSFNSSGAPQLRAAVNHCTALVRGCPIAVLCQEHHADTAKLPDLQAQLKSFGWRLAASKAVKTAAGGWSAGVGVCTPSHVAAGVEAGTVADHSPVSAPGRIASLWVQQVAPGGIQLVSCYLFDTEQGTARNVDLLTCALRAAQASGCPWVVALDAQEDPLEFLRWAAPLIDKARGTVVHPDEPTHIPGVGACRTLDYFIIDKALAPAVKRVTTISEFRCHSDDAGYTVAPKPHRAVQLELRQKFSPLTVRCLRLPRAFPRAKPVG